MGAITRHIRLIPKRAYLALKKKDTSHELAYSRKGGLNPRDRELCVERIKKREERNKYEGMTHEDFSWLYRVILLEYPGK